MNKSVNMDKVIEWTKYLTLEKQDLAEIKAMHQESMDFIGYYNWCGKILESYAGLIYPGIIGIFLFKIEPKKVDIDEWFWVVVGDVPPAYLTTEQCPNPATALDGYIGAMQEWVEAARKGESVENLIPVNVPANREYAENLEKRLRFLDDHILSRYTEDLKT